VASRELLHRHQLRRQDRIRQRISRDHRPRSPRRKPYAATLFEGRGAAKRASTSARRIIL
jgi:hypothetical protein